MKSRLPIALAFIAFAGGIGVQNAYAQQPPPGAPVPPPSAERHGPPHWVLSPADRAALLDARIAAVRAGLKLTPDQEKLWPPVEAAVRAAEKSAAERREKFHNEPHHEDMIAMMRRMSEAATAHGATLKTIVDAAAPLYASLTEEQKHRLPLLLHGLRWMGAHMGMMGHEMMGHKMMGPDAMHEGMREGMHDGGPHGMMGPHDEPPFDEEDEE